ncbi:TIGR02611 family protein [Arsenicicoccus sp. oral taxon 190]|uniref:TIGR02611 family protein n=1 Tax=Arsenicicoccus sp. oral taxon 190 TaxID=1658671 RepID=UPI00067A1582|nr:TIGR02611 family protein [Arsenicicoccus sp. oral taxon 190]AKT51786.1 hypothetical protein ADJ73_11760 [Arsenicicoccus sp. oral taxon 190]
MSYPDDSHDTGPPSVTERDWEWRRRIRSDRRSHAVYRAVVGVVGLVIVVVGLILVPFPGPGWLIVFLGVLLWSTEFAWAQRLHRWGMGHLRRWTDWVQAQPVWVRCLVGLATAAFVGLVVLGTMAVAGVPGWLPDVVEDPLRDVLP